MHRYEIYAFENGREVCGIAWAGQPCTAHEASMFAAELREEFPNAIVAIIPRKGL